MSLENVQAFYERIADDREFLAELEASQTQEEGKKILAEAGYDFTTEELEEYTSQMLESTDTENNMFEELNEEQMTAVVGGFKKVISTESLQPALQQPYGAVEARLRRRLAVINRWKTRGYSL